MIDTGNRKIVYRESAPGAYDDVEVKLGPRCGSFYPVLHGLEPGDRVVTAGSFMVDAETRLNPSAGSIYFGGSSGKSGATAVTARPSMRGDEDARVTAGLSKLSPEDRRLAQDQEFCPVLGGRLGLMGTPIKVILNSKPLFLCCEGCRSQALGDPNRTLGNLHQ